MQNKPQLLAEMKEEILMILFLCISLICSFFVEITFFLVLAILNLVFALLTFGSILQKERIQVLVELKAMSEEMKGKND